MLVKPGTRAVSTVCTTEVIIVRGPMGDLDLRCGGAPMVEPDTRPSALSTQGPTITGPTLVGKRYGTSELELLCTKAGAGGLSVGDEPLPLKDSKPLPASD